MPAYELKLFSPATGTPLVLSMMRKFTFSSGNNLLAIEHAKEVVAESGSACDHAVLRCDDAVIWEKQNTPGPPA